MRRFATPDVAGSIRFDEAFNSIRISMPYLDPKIYDDSTYDAHKYAERRDDIGRMILSVMMQARNRLATR